MAEVVSLKNFPVIETKRLLLREMRAEDDQDLFHILANIDVVRYYDLPVLSIEQTQRTIARHHARFTSNEAIRWGITLKQEHVLIGNCGYFWDKSNSYAVMSYVLDQPYWNKGVMTEALHAIIQFGFQYYSIYRYEAHVARPNEGSSRVLKKLGFHEEGVLKQHFCENHRFHDEIIYVLSGADWERMGNSIGMFS
ncbi:MAG TPA: GNAT family protein [Dictyobacter sp.]|jgi:ribosomal-protein-alanine N-acetyltransferase|nr:GNAT family protein [Dictyobacter sp.]